VSGAQIQRHDSGAAEAEIVLVGDAGVVHLSVAGLTAELAQAAPMAIKVRKRRTP